MKPILAKDVRYTAPIVFTPGKDFMRTDRGVSWGIKLTKAGDFQFVSIFTQAADGTYGMNGPATDLMTLDDAFDMHVTEYSSLEEWLKQRIAPALNRWLAAAFPPIAGGIPPAPLTLAEQADLLIRGIQIIVAPDGTLTASAS